MFDELNTVALTRDIKEYNLSKGDVGTIVHVYDNGKTYEVEFFSPLGETVAVLTLKQSELCVLEVNTTYKWAEPVWSGLKTPAYIESSSYGTQTKIFCSQL